MSVANEVLAVRYDGNGSTSEEYVIPFPFLDTDHIFAAVSGDGVETAVNLDASGYAVVRDEDGQGGTLTTVVAVTDPARIIIYRDVPLTQPTELQAAGPLPSGALETALDRLTMQVQQINRHVNELGGTSDGFYVQPPSGSPEEQRDVRVWANALELGSIAPQWTGQLGVQFDTQELYISQSQAVGDWELYRPRWQKEYRVYPNGTEIPLSGNATLGFMSEDTAIKRIFIASPGSTNSEVQVSVFADAVLLGTLTILDGVEWAEVASLLPSTVITKGSKLAAHTDNPSFGSGDRVGLDVILECQNI